MEQELKEFNGKAGKARATATNCITFMKAQASDTKTFCQCFYAVLPKVRTDFFAIQSKVTDHAELRLRGSQLPINQLRVNSL